MRREHSGCCKSTCIYFRILTPSAIYRYGPGEEVLARRLEALLPIILLLDLTKHQRNPAAFLRSLYLHEPSLLQAGGGSLDGVEGCGRGIEEIDELVRGLWTGLLHDGHGTEEREGQAWASGHCLKRSSRNKRAWDRARTRAEAWRWGRPQ